MHLLRLHEILKQGDFIYTVIPRRKEDALALARFCREKRIHLCFAEFLWRGEYALGWSWGEKMPRERFYTKADIEEIVEAAGEYYFGRFSICEVGAVLYQPWTYTVNRRVGEYESLPPVRTHGEARDAYVAYCRRWLDYERKEIGGGPLMVVDAGIVFKYLAQAGADILCLEVFPGDPNPLHAALRGAARAYGRPWGVHIAMNCYGGFHLGELWHRRWKTSLYYAYIAGADFVYSGNACYTYNHIVKRGFHSRDMHRARRTLREMYQFARVRGPLVRIGIVHGNLDGTPGLWNRYVWGQRGKKWREGPAERGWRAVDRLFRKEDWAKPTVGGDLDFSGNPPLGQYDIVPIEAPLEVLRRYRCLVFLAWNTMTREIYGKLKRYVQDGGRLVMFLPHLNVDDDRAKPVRLFRDGDFSDLFGVRVIGRERTDVYGAKFVQHSSIRSYRFPVWNPRFDPMFMGIMTPAKVEVRGARVIAGYDNYFHATKEEVLSRPLLVEKSLGKGKAFLVTAWEHPADDGLHLFTEEIIRTVVAGEQGDIRLIGGDRVRYAVYDARARRGGRYRVVYLLNTDLDSAQAARLYVRRRLIGEIRVPPSELRIAYCCGALVIVPDDKRVDLAAWRSARGRHEFRFFSAATQRLHVFNLGEQDTTFSVNGVRSGCGPRMWKTVRLRRTVDASRVDFFAPNFLEEPPVRYGRPGRAY